MQREKFYKNKYFWIIVIIISSAIAPFLPKSATINNEVLESNTLTAESNTSDSVDLLINKAKEDIKKASDTDLKTALSFIKDNIENLYKDNKTMENAIYYGALLEYSNKDILKDIGMDTVQAVKYVYRNVEKIEDISTQENLKQIKENLNKLK